MGAGVSGRWIGARELADLYGMGIWSVRKQLRGAGVAADQTRRGYPVVDVLRVLGTPEDMVNLSEAGELLGHTGPGNLRRCLENKGIPTVKLGRHRMVKLADLERYEQQITPPGAERRSERPRGWLGADAAAEAARVDVTTLRTWVKRGEVEAVCVGKSYFYNPAGLRAAAERRRQPQPVDWEALIEVHPDDVTKLKTWLQQSGFPVRLYLAPDGSGRVRNCTTRAGAAAWRQSYVPRRAA